MSLMIKWMKYLALAVLVGGSWLLYSNTGGEIKTQTELIEQERAKGDPEDKLGKMSSHLLGLEGQKTFVGILLAFLSAGLVGIFFVLEVLPAFAHRVTHAVYDSAEMMEHDVMHDARSLLAQGEYESAIQAFRQAAAADPLNRLPWVEIAKIYKTNLGDPASAIQTIRHALESQEWEVSDAAYFLFRLAELYNEVDGNRTTAVAIMEQVIQEFPGTRHSANATHRLHDWKLEDEAAAAAAQEQAYLDQLGATPGQAEYEPQPEEGNVPDRHA